MGDEEREGGYDGGYDGVGQVTNDEAEDIRQWLMHIQTVQVEYS